MGEQDGAGHRVFLTGGFEAFLRLEGFGPGMGCGRGQGPEVRLNPMRPDLAAICASAKNRLFMLCYPSGCS